MWIKMNMFLVIALWCVIVKYNVIYAKRILFVANLPAYSHQISYRGLLLALNKRGHEIVLVTTDPMKNSSLANYTEIDVHYLYNIFEYMKQLDNKPYTFRSLTEASLTLSFLGLEQFTWDIAAVLSREVFKNPEMKKLYAADSNEHFDAVIVEQGISPAMSAFAYRFKAPLIGVSSLDVYNQVRYMHGGLILPSHRSNWENDMSNDILENNLSFWKRLINFCKVWMHIYNWANVRIPSHDALVKEYLGEDVPSVLDIIRNMSVYLVNKYPMISIPRQELPNIIFHHGVHIAAPPPPLPKELKPMLDKASDGFIYVSFGTNVNWGHMPKNTLENFIEAFASLPWKVLWKIDPDLIPNKFRNIFALKWFPQQSILAHPNIKLFIYQGGIQSTEEAIYHGVPLIGFPMMWDQTHQVLNAKRMGIAMCLDYKKLSIENIVTAVYEVINNKRYKEQAKELSEVYKDAPYDTIQNAIWWIEYTMRHNGLTRLQDRIYEDPWYQRYDWDIISFLAISAFTTSLILFYTLFQILRFICKRLRILCKDSHYYIKSKSQ